MVFVQIQSDRIRNNPRHSMYAVYAYIDPSNHPNVGIYAIHGVFGNEFFQCSWTASLSEQRDPAAEEAHPGGYAPAKPVP